MNLQDVMATTAGKNPPAARRKELMLAKIELEHLDRARERWDPHGDDTPIQRMHDAFEEELAQAALDGFQLPRVSTSTTGFGSAIMRSPRTTGASVKNLADKVGFLVMPAKYLSHQAQGMRRDYPGEIEQLFETAHRARDRYGDIVESENWLQEHCALYVLSPVAFYSAEAHMNAESDGEIYAPRDVAQAFMALSMSMPLFRSLKCDVEALRDDWRRQQERLTRLETEVRNLQARVDAAQRQIEAERLARVRAEHANAKQVQVLAYDPMLLILDRKKMLADDAPVFIGPAWGPDFEDHVLPALGLDKISGQRKLLEATCWR